MQVYHVISRYSDVSGGAEEHRTFDNPNAQITHAADRMRELLKHYGAEPEDMLPEETLDEAQDRLDEACAPSCNPDETSAFVIIYETKLESHP